MFTQQTLYSKPLGLETDLLAITEEQTCGPPKPFRLTRDVLALQGTIEMGFPHFVEGIRDQ